MEKFEQHRNDPNAFLNSLTEEEFEEYVRDKPLQEYQDLLKSAPDAIRTQEQ